MKYGALIVFFVCNSVFAQYSGPAVDACLDYAKREQKQNGGSGSVVFERDQSLLIERYTRKLGSQFVASILTGNGAVVYDGAPGAELSFLCLLADDKRPLFFQWLARANAPAAMQCLRNPDPQKGPRPCFDLMLRIAEQDLTIAYAERFQEANRHGESALAAFRRSNDEWRRYHDAECARRRDLAPAGVAPEDYAIACSVELTRRRALDMR
jgi:uncharacterized protein YecT (DUF1311 family)